MIEKYVVFGDYATSAAGWGNWKELAEIIEDTPNSIGKRVFETEAELHAYLCGLEDADGWLSAYPLDEDEVKKLSKRVRLEDIDEPY